MNDFGSLESQDTKGWWTRHGGQDINRYGAAAAEILIEIGSESSQEFSWVYL